MMSKSPKMTNVFCESTKFRDLDPDAAQEFKSALEAAQDDVELSPDERESADSFEFSMNGDDMIAVAPQHSGELVYFKSHKTKGWVFSDALADDDPSELERLELAFDI